MSNKDQIFADSMKTCEGRIDRTFIARIIAQDKTNTIRKYLNSYGIMQLAFFLKEVAHKLDSNKEIYVEIYDHIDQRQKKTQEQGNSIPLSTFPLPKAKKNSKLVFGQSPITSKYTYNTDFISLPDNWGTESGTLTASTYTGKLIPSPPKKKKPSPEDHIAVLMAELDED